MNKNIFLVITALAFLSLAVTESFAKITAASVRGSVAYKTGKNWQPLKSGMDLSEGTKISTGVNSTAIIKMDSHTLAIKPLTMIKIYENTLNDNTSTNRIGLRRGTIHTKVSRSKRIKTVFKVSTPVATSSVRGTEDIISYGPSRGMNVIMITGVAVGSARNGSTKILRGALEFNKKSGSSLPGNPLDPLKGKALVSLFSRHISPDEKLGFTFFGSDFFDSPRGFLYRLGIFQKKALLNIALDWQD